MIDAILEGDTRVPRKQRHTAKRIFERLRDEYGFDRPADHSQGLRAGAPAACCRRCSCRCPTRPGHAQCDFGEALAVIGGVERKVHYLVLDLPHSDGCFVKAYSC